MKKTVISALMFFMALTVVHAQTTGKFDVGFRFGAQIGMHKTDSDFDHWLKINNLTKESLPNVNMALFGAYGFTNYIGLQTELNFKFGQGIKGRDGSSWVDTTYSSLDIPLLLKINFLPSASRFGILAGPYFTAALGKANTKYTGFSNDDEKNDIDAPNFGFTAGLFYAHPIGFGSAIVDIRYNTDFGQSTIKLPADFGFMQRRGIVISVGIGVSI